MMTIAVSLQAQGWNVPDARECSKSDLSPLTVTGTVNKDTLTNPVTCPKRARSLHMQLSFLKVNWLVVKQHLIENMQEIALVPDKPDFPKFHSIGW